MLRFCKPNHNDVTIINSFHIPPSSRGRNRTRTATIMINWYSSCFIEVQQYIETFLNCRGSPPNPDDMYIMMCNVKLPEHGGTTTIQKVQCNFPTECQNSIFLTRSLTCRLKLMFFYWFFFLNHYINKERLCHLDKKNTQQHEQIETGRIPVIWHYFDDRKTGGYNQNIWALFHETAKSASSPTSHWITC